MSNNLLTSHEPALTDKIGADVEEYLRAVDRSAHELKAPAIAFLDSIRGGKNSKASPKKIDPAAMGSISLFDLHNAETLPATPTAPLSNVAMVERAVQPLTGPFDIFAVRTAVEKLYPGKLTASQTPDAFRKVTERGIKQGIMHLFQHGEGRVPNLYAHGPAPKGHNPRR